MRRRTPMGLVAAVGIALVHATLPNPASAETIPGECGGEESTLIATTPWVLEALDAASAQTIATGQGVIVAVVDSGVDIHNHHLMDAVDHGVDLVGDGADADGREDRYGHGTAVAGIIAAREVDGSGLRGIAPDARILPVRVFSSDGDEARAAGIGPRIDRIAEGIRYAADHHAQIINVSLSDTEDSADLRAAVQHATNAGALVIASAGNRATAENLADGLRYPAAYPDVLGVAAVDRDLTHSENSFSGAQVDVAAPGQSVHTAVREGHDCVYANDSGSSSFATAYASGAAALLAERYPHAGPQAWRERLQASALRDHIDRRDDALGWGVVRPFEALTIALDSTVPGHSAYARPRSATLPASAAARTDPGARTVRLALGVVGGAGLLWAVLWTVSLARRPREAEAT